MKFQDLMSGSGKTFAAGLAIALLAVNISCASPEKTTTESNTLWYRQPANEWMEALPLGNGRLGAMVYGGTAQERIALNEITLWSGQPDEQQERSCGKEKLDEIRQLFFKGDYSGGNRMATEYLSGTPHSFGSHVPMGDLVLEFPDMGAGADEYYRELNLETAVNSVQYIIGGVQYRREAFCSNPAGVLVIHLKCNKERQLNFDVSVDLLREATVTVDDGKMEFDGKVSFPNNGDGGVNFKGYIAVTSPQGEITNTMKKLQIRDAQEATLIVDIRTDYINKDYQQTCLQTVDRALGKDYRQLKADHITDHGKLYRRASLFLENSQNDLKHIPTDERWKRVKEGKGDVTLDALFFNYARYLLIAASREDSPLPANLQGIWNDNLACNMGWTCDYHLDINTQQNYWMANPANLAECNSPLFHFIRKLSEEGSKTARNVYGAGGWTAHTMTNVWGYTSPGSGVNWGLHPTGGAWLATHLWRHYQFTQDKNFLAEEAYPLLKKTARFFMDYMVEDPRFGYLVTGPSTSPENSFIYNEEELSLSMMPTCDILIVKEILTACVESADMLRTDEAFADSLNRMIMKLPPLKISKNGALREWLEDFEQAQPNHRHTSHLLGLYPFDQISVNSTPELAGAAQKSLELRLSASNWEDVEWSRANSICFNARLGNGNEAHTHLNSLFRNLTRENLLTVSPKGIAGAPYDIFIFDGNEAAGAGMCEMLLQSYGGVIRFLPALPDTWLAGSFKGLCTEGGNVVDLDWKKGKPASAIIKASCDNFCKIDTDNIRSAFLNDKKIEIPVMINGLKYMHLQKDDVLKIVW